MEKKILMYLLYAALIEIRERSYTNKDKASYWITDLLHNIPLRLNGGDDEVEVYNDLLEKVESLGLQSWIDNRLSEFNERYPDCKK